MESLFGNCEIRVLYRATNVYVQLLYSSFHPDLLTNYADRYVFLHRIATNYKKENNKIINLEIKEISQGDIPYFTINANNTKIHNTHLKNINSKIQVSTIDKIKNKIQDMNSMRMYRQIAAINTTFMTQEYTGHIKTTIKFKNDVQKKYNEEDLVKIVMKIADYMLQRSIVGKKSGIVSRTWLESKDSGLGFNIFDNASGDIYNGLSGIALFYHYLWKISKNIKYKYIVDEIVRSILDTLPNDTSFKYIDKIKSGAFNGLGGIAYTLFYIGESKGVNKYTKQILNILDILDYNIKNVRDNDIINEVGNLGILISIYQKTQNKFIKNKALIICEKIFNELNKNKITIKDKPGISWNKKGYVGYAHGNAGVIAQLYRWYNITKNEKALELIEQALLYETSMYSNKNKNWYRAVNEKHFTCGWCHGAPGILLSKIQLKKFGYKNEKLDKDIAIAIDKIITDGLNNDISLCHGDMGNMSILKESAIILNNKKLYNQVVSTIEGIIDFILELMKTEKFKNNEHNGFMLGLSGIAYEILRIGKENEIPNVLGLE